MSNLKQFIEEMKQADESKIKGQWNFNFSFLHESAIWLEKQDTRLLLKIEEPKSILPIGDTSKFICKSANNMSRILSALEIMQRNLEGRLPTEHQEYCILMKCMNPGNFSCTCNKKWIEEALIEVDKLFEEEK